jgi:hypothetical protein
MRLLSVFFSPLLIFTLVCADSSTVGIKPEQIYQKNLKWEQVVGAWEILPEQDPLTERGKAGKGKSFRSLMTLRKDGTCRVFDEKHPMGKDGIWNIDGHKMYITFPDGGAEGFYVYGVAGDFMVTRSPLENGPDQLWSRVK